MFGFTTQAAMDRALERQARAHRQHVLELSEKIDRLRGERDALRGIVDAQMKGEEPSSLDWRRYAQRRRLMSATERLEEYMNRPDDERTMTMAQWSEQHG